MVDVRRLIDDINLQIPGVERQLNRQAIAPLQQELEQSKENSMHNAHLSSLHLYRENNCDEKISITSQQRKKLHSALISAFPKKSLLEQLLDYELDKNLNKITQEGDLDKTIFELIKAANSEGWVLDLVDAAHRSNPGNPELQAIAKEL